VAAPPLEQLLNDTYAFYRRQLVRCEEAREYLGKRGIRDRAVMERMRIGYAPGASCAVICNDSVTAVMNSLPAV
jgi:hypothetical protein